MILLNRLASIVAWIVRRDTAERLLDEEMEAYVEMSAAAHERDGMAPEDARRLARIELGGVEQAKERVRTGRHGQLLDEVARDLRYGWRMFVRTPGFTAVVLLTLALGIGANTAIFSLIDTLLLRSLPVHKPAELVLVNLRERQTPGSGGESLSYAIVRALDQQHDVFSAAGGFTGTSFEVQEAGAKRLPGSLVTGRFYDVLGIQPAAGRLLTRDDDEAGATPVAVISDSYWQRQFGRSPAAIGQTLHLDGVPVTIVGVTPQGFDGATVAQTTDVTIAIGALPIVRPTAVEWMGPGNFWLRVLARPATGIGAAEAAARLNAVWPSLSDSVIAPHWIEARRRAMAQSVFVFESGATGWTYLREVYGKPLVILQAVAGLVLLVACANVASLFLARASGRRREIALRLAIGAGRRRIVRQLLIEGLMVSAAGAAIGIGVAWALGRLLIDLISTGPFAIVVNLTPHWHVLAFSTAVATITGVVFGVAPALQTGSAGPSLALKADDRTSTKRSTLLPSLVVVQVALSLVLVAGAGLFVRTLRNLQHVDAGFRTDSVVVAPLPRGKVPSFARLLDAARRVPGVHSASVATHTPLDGSSWGEPIVPAGQPLPEVDNALLIGVGPSFFDALQIPLVAGRDIAPGDRAGQAGVAVINERYAARYFPDRNPIGQRLSSTLFGQPADLEIVGVVKDTVTGNLRRPRLPIVYVAFDQYGNRLSPSLVIRTSGAAATEQVRRALQAELPNLSIDLRPLAAQISATIVQERMMATLAGGFGVLALVLSSVGLYGLLAYRVTLRAKEIGIRMALGASGSGVVALVLLNGMRLLCFGVVLGYPAASAASRAVSAMLFGLSPADPATMAGAVAALAAAAGLASYLPARRASRVDPLVVLRHD